MELHIDYAFLPHTDPEASIAFYCGLLGFEIRSDVGSGRMRWIGVQPPGGSATAILLHPPAVDPGVTDDEGRMIAEMMAKGTYAMIALTTPDLNAVFDTLQAGDADIVQEPTDQPYGIRDCAVRDPAGNLIRINQAS